MTRCIIFDVDGVLIDSPHELAWRETFERLLESEWSECEVEEGAFTTEMYQTHVAGRPRFEGAAAALAWFGIPDEDGSRCRRYGDLKQSFVEHLISIERFKVFGDAVDLAMRAEAAGLKLAVASSSKNANRMMEHLLTPDSRPLASIFASNVCGRDFEKGKPDPAIFLQAAREAGVEPGCCVVVEDAPNGIGAATAAGMASVGIARLGDEAILCSAGAHRVVTTLGQLTTEELLSLCG